MSNYKLSFTIESLPKMGNVWGRANRWTKQKENLSWYRMVILAVGKNKPKTPLHKFQLTLVRHSSTEGDFDGITMSFKQVIDGLKHCGVIQDDKISNTGQWNVSWKKAKRGQGKIEVTVEEKSDV